MTSGNTPCKVCGAASEAFADARILNRHDITYFACPKCEFIQTEEPHWLAESYAEAINRTDIGYVSRNIALANSSFSLVAGLFDQDGRFIDYGGGYGLFVRMMRDKGLNWYWDDKHCQNLFAQGFEAEKSGADTFDLLTCFEVMEHTVEPIEEVEKMLKLAPVIVFSTCLISTPRIKPSEWWYYGLDHGQHVSLFSRKSLEAIASRLGLSLWSNGNDLHILSRRELSAWRVSVFMNRRVSRLTNYVFRRPSLLGADFEYLKSLANH